MIPDIDIDMADREKILSLIPNIPASIIKNNEITKHNVGVYFQEIPTEEITGYASLDFKKAEELGYFKIDFLNNKIYEKVKNEEHLNQLLEQEPVWEMLEIKEICEQIVHIGNYFDIVYQLKPKSIEELAIVLAIIRPAKRHLLKFPKETIKKQIWIKPSDNSYYFSKAHSIAYATAIAVQMNLMINEVDDDNS